MEKNSGRILLQEKIEQYEAEGRFNDHVNDDPPFEPLKPGEVDYFRKKLSTKIKNKWCHFLLNKFIKKQNKQHKNILKEIIGLEKLQNIKTGAIVTSNHFHPFDSYPVIQVAKKLKKKLNTIVAELNYAVGQGFYGFIFKNKSTIPLAQNPQVMSECMRAINYYLKKGDLVLIYPEQAMWLNYRKPRPLKEGAFRFAIKANVPVIACFTTMQDSEYLDDDGFPVQECTFHILDVLYPNPDLSVKENMKYLKEQNEKLTKQKYEEVYGIKLQYNTKD